MALVFDKLFIFSVSEKAARVFEFCNGTNLITSNKIDGNKVGKSVVLKSLYHSLGADCYYEDKWDGKDKIFVVDISVDGKAYRVYRHDRLFKIFDGVKPIFITNDRNSLGYFYSDLFDFRLQLPNRAEEILEIPPPAYFFLLNYIDQDKMECTNFASFSNLKQYANFKKPLLFGHFGVFNEQYYELVKKEEILKGEQSVVSSNMEVLHSLIEKIKDTVVDIDYSTDIEALKAELDLRRTEYINIIKNLNKIKKTLIQYRNTREDLMHELKSLKSTRSGIKSEVKSINNHVCPLCSGNIEDIVGIRAEKYNTMEDLILLSDGLELEIQKLNRSIERETDKYNDQLAVLNSYKAKIGMNKDGISDIVKNQGVIEIRDKLIKEQVESGNEFNSISGEIKNIRAKLRKYHGKKKSVDKKYYDLMLAGKTIFNLKEIDNSKFEDLLKTFAAQGSNKGIATIVWYYNLLKLKAEFNPTAIRFPMVLDSPTDMELDEEREELLWDYIFDYISADTQLIVSSLGVPQKAGKNRQVDNIISIETPKYQLLTSEDYEEHKSLLFELTEARLDE